MKLESSLLFHIDKVPRIKRVGRAVCGVLDLRIKMSSKLGFEEHFFKKFHTCFLNYWRNRRLFIFEKEILLFHDLSSNKREFISGLQSTKPRISCYRHNTNHTLHLSMLLKPFCTASLCVRMENDFITTCKHFGPPHQNLPYTSKIPLWRATN